MYKHIISSIKSAIEKNGEERRMKTVGWEVTISHCWHHSKEVTFDQKLIRRKPCEELEALFPEKSEHG